MAAAATRSSEGPKLATVHGAVSPQRARKGTNDAGSDDGPNAGSLYQSELSCCFAHDLLLPSGEMYADPVSSIAQTL